VPGAGIKCIPAPSTSLGTVSAGGLVRPREGARFTIPWACSPAASQRIRDTTRCTRVTRGRFSPTRRHRPHESHARHTAPRHRRHRRFVGSRHEDVVLLREPADDQNLRTAILHYPAGQRPLSWGRAARHPGLVRSDGPARRRSRPTAASGLSRRACQRPLSLQRRRPNRGENLFFQSPVCRRRRPRTCSSRIT